LLDGAADAAKQYMSGSGTGPPFRGLQSGGPVQAVFYVYHDFFAYVKRQEKETMTN
jgi:hypothetical protein